MKTYRKLRRLGSKEPLPVHFNTIVESLGRVLGSGSTDPATYGDADTYAEKYLAYNLRRKEFAPHGEDSKAEARAFETKVKFLLRERLNGHLNATRTYGYNASTGRYESDEAGLRVLYRARDIIRDILGDAPNYQAIARKCDFGNGASATLPRKEAQRPRKFKRGLSVTRGLLSASKLLIAESPFWCELLNPETGTWYAAQDGVTSSCLDTLKIVSGGVFDLVRKDKDIDRVIIKEPELNGFVQKGIGREMRECLRRYTKWVPEGINLNTSGGLNSDLAMQGSRDGHIGTVDGKQASDSITLSACDFLLPEAWYALLCAARSPYVIIDGKPHRLQMMSGMGNGFTFELESIIFYAIGLACAERSKLPFAEKYVSIHGDDLIVPSDVMWFVREAYAALGISMNKAKSFGEGPFRESCGGHWFNGSSVKPFYVKFSNGLKRGDWFWLANSLLLWLSERKPSYLAGKKGKDLVEHLLYLRDYARSFSRNPVEWIAPFDYSRRAGIYSRPPRSTGASYRFLSVVDKPTRQKYDDDVAYLAWLHRPQVSDRLAGLLCKSLDADAYSFNSEVVECSRWVRSNTWHVDGEGAGWPPLWAALRLHKGRYS